MAIKIVDDEVLAVLDCEVQEATQPSVEERVEPKRPYPMKIVGYGERCGLRFWSYECIDRIVLQTLTWEDVIDTLHNYLEANYNLQIALQQVRLSTSAHGHFSDRYGLTLEGYVLQNDGPLSPYANDNFQCTFRFITINI
jgi:hypothetical protein